MFNQICSFQNLHLAYLKARKCKRYRAEILRFSYNLEDNLLQLQEQLLNQTYQHGGYRVFTVCDSKKRQIKAAPFRDRVVHHALCNIIEPIFDVVFIYDSYACRKEKGTHKAIKRSERFLRSLCNKAEPVRGGGLEERKIYCLECDISKYFANINHKVLYSLIAKKLSDEKTLWLLKKIIKSDKEMPNKGIPIGNLTSQLFANIYLNTLDQFVKHQLRFKHYIRYMDDFLLLGDSKIELHQIKEKIQEFLQEQLKIELHPKKVNIFPIEKGIDFLGYRIYGNYRLLRKKTIKRFIKRTKACKDEESIQSWLAYAEFANSWRLIESLLKKLDIDLI